MKTRLLAKWILGLTFCGLFTGGCLKDASINSPVQASAATETELEVAVQPVSYEIPAAAEQTAGPVAASSPDLSQAAVEPVATEKTFPANLRISAPLMEVIKLADSGVEESVLLSFVTNSPSTFNLGADEIIYLSDIGVPGTVITSMLQHDQGLQGMATVTLATALPPPAPPQVAPQAEPIPTAVPPLAPPENEVSDSTFYNGLSPYGSWVEVSGYGRCWRPMVAVANSGWQPYFDGGHWVYTDCGWYWLSDYSWGWAPFHYGRWFQHYQLGWCWAPDTVWAPSWVCWRQSDDYCGWAPLPPFTGFTVGIGFTFRGRHVGDFDDCGLSAHAFRFIAWRDFHGRHLHGRELDPGRVTEVFNKTVVVNKLIQNNHTVINQGIAPERVANVSHREVRRVALHETAAGRPANGRSESLDTQQRILTVYRPQTLQPQRNSSSTVQRTVEPGRPVTRPNSDATVSGRDAFPSHVEPRSGQVSRGTTAIPKQIPDARSGSHEREVRTEHTVSTDASSSAPPQVNTVLPQRPIPITRPSTPSSASPIQGPSGRFAPAQPWAAPGNGAMPSQQPAVSRATPWLNNHQAPVAPAPVQRAPSYAAPAYNPRPVYTPSAPQQSYSPPAAAVPRYAPVESRPAPSRPAMSEVSRPAAPPAASVSRASEAQSRSTPSAAPAASGNNPRR